MKAFLLSTLLLFTYQFTLAQYNVSGHLIDAKNESLGFATIRIVQAKDSAFVAGTTTDVDGKFTVSTKQSDTYLLAISMIGYTSFYSDAFVLDEENSTKNFSTITLESGGIELNTIEVTATKPLFERKIDRTVINLENRVTTAGATALEVLEQAPSVIVDRTSNSISMLGKDGVNVMINDRLSYMPTDALLQFLEGMNADNIISIELITTPPARFDAEGNAGYINIILKKNPFDGLNGNYSIMGGLGKGEVFRGNVNFNYRQNRVNLYGAYGYSLRAIEQVFTSSSSYGTPDDFLKTDVVSNRVPSQNNHNARLGLDYELTDKTTVGVLMAAYDNRWHMDAINDGVVRTSVADTFSTINLVEDNNWQHFQANVNLAHKFKNGGKLNFDVDYLFYDNENPTDYIFNFRDNNENPLSTETLFSGKVTPFTIRVGQLDYERDLSDKFNLSFGAKMVQSDFENDVLIKENEIENTGFTSKSSLTEDIYAAYAQGRYQVNEKFGVQLGLRYEFTDTELNDSNEGLVVDREFGKLFPTLFVDYKLNDNNQINATYSKRIDRPSFSNMAPFMIFMDQNTLLTGNPALQPAFINSFEVNYRYKTVNLAIQYSKEDSSIAGFQSQFDLEANRQIIMPINLKEQNLFVASLNFPVKVTDWWNMRISTMYMWKENTVVNDLGTFTLDQSTFRANGSQNFKLPKDFNVELSGFYTSPFINGNFKIDAIWGLNFGVQKKLKNGRLSFNIQDIFNSIQSYGVTEIPELNVFADRSYNFNRRTFSITYSSSFGNKKVKKARNRNSSGDEKNRVN